MVQDCIYRFSRINVKSHNNISSLPRETGPFRPTWTTKFIVNLLMSFTSWTIHSSLPLMLSFSIITIISPLNLWGQLQLIRKVYNLHKCWVNIGRVLPNSIWLDLVYHGRRSMWRLSQWLLVPSLIYLWKDSTRTCLWTPSSSDLSIIVLVI